MSRYMSAKEVAQEFFEGRFSYWTVLKRAKSGVLPCIKDGGRYLFLRSALEEWESKALHRPTWMQL